jgi:gliding motility-associated protein GldM
MYILDFKGMKTVIIVLVFFAITACNSSKKEQNFKVLQQVEASLKRSAMVINFHNRYMFAEFEIEYRRRPEKMQPYVNKARHIVEITKNFVAYVDSLKSIVTNKAGSDSGNITSNKFVEGKDTKLSAKLFVDGNYGTELKNKINETRNKILSFFDTLDRQHIATELIAEDSITTGKQWEVALFTDLTVISVMVLLEKIKIDAITLEADALRTLWGGMSIDSQTYSDVIAHVNVKSDIVVLGQKFEADIFPILYKPKEVFSVTVNGENSGIVYGQYKYEAIASKEGQHTVEGFIKYTKERYDTMELPFEINYTVVKDTATIKGVK